MKRLFLVLPLVAVLAACGTPAAQKAQQKAARADVVAINQQLAHLRENEPLPVFHDSAALHVQDAYYTADADPNKIWYVILVNYLGEPYAQYTTRGAPQPAGDQVTNPVQLYCQHIGNGSNIPDGCGTIGLPEPNGVHQGGSNAGYVAILTSGAMIRFPAETAHISDQPFNIKGAVHVSINENAPISKTDVTKTTNGVVPGGTGTRQK
jgi:hypothetical protein